jgi:hypothetical protein
MILLKLHLERHILVHKAAPNMHRSPMQEAINADYFGVRPGTRTHKMTPEEEEQIADSEALALDS